MTGAKWLPAVCVAVALGSIAARADDARVGRDLYYGFRPFTAGTAVLDTGRPASLMACASCHGALAAGKAEGGTRFPTLQWHDLITVSDRRPAYDGAEAIKTAIATGVGSDGKMLAQVMPRYRLTPQELLSLLAYFRIAGSEEDVPPGITRTTIRLGSLLPLSGPSQKAGQDILASIKSVLDTANQNGGIHGRRIELVSADSFPNAQVAAESLATQKIYAVMSGLWDRPAEVEVVFAKHRIAMLATLSPRLRAKDIGPWGFDLLAPTDVQQDLLVRSMSHCNAGGERWIFQPPSVTPLSLQGVRVVTGEHAAASTFTHRHNENGCVGYTISNAARLQNVIPPQWQQRLVTPFPASLANAARPGIWHMLGVASARVTLELLSASGARLSQSSAIQSIGALDGFEPLPGAPIRLSKAQRFAWDPGVITTDPNVNAVIPAQTSSVR